MNSRFSFISILSVATFSLLGLTSCGDIEQNLRLNPDGSGTLETTFDVGEMMGMVKGLGDMKSDDVTISSDQEADTVKTEPEAPKDPMQLIIDRVTNPEYDKDFDTLISFLTLMPDSVKAKQTRMDLVDKITVHLKSPAKSSGLTMGLQMKFDNPPQLKEIIKYVEDMDNSPTTSLIPSSGPTGIQSQAFLGFEVDFKAGWIRFDSVDYSGMTSQIGMTPDSLMSSEDTGMMEMMFGSTKIRSVIHVPGEVISCTNKEAILTKDNKVIIENGFMDAVKKGKIDSYTIYFTPKK